MLGGALLLRLVLALVTDGYPYDMSCFVAWGDKLAAEGPAAFYSEGYFADYPPGYLWVLGLVGAIRAALHIAYESKWTYFLLALVPSLCDCGLAWLVYRTAKRSSRGVKEHTALVLTAQWGLGAALALCWQGALGWLLLVVLMPALGVNLLHALQAVAQHDWPGQLIAWWG